MYFNIFLLIVTVIGYTKAELPCGDWISYRDEKCFKVLNTVVPQSEAISLCEKINGKLGLINSYEEQDLVYNDLKYKNIADDVWIAIKMQNKVFKRMDDLPLIYTNWSSGRPLNQEGYDCVEISNEFQGKWLDSKCNKKNAVLCEKNQEWSNNKIENIVQELRKEINLLKQNLVPIGFIYVQLSGQPDPKSLWPNTNWNNTSSQYGGLFFRVEGENSAAFGQTQSDQTQRLIWKSVSVKQGTYTHGPKEIAKAFDTPLYTGTFVNWENQNFAIQIHHTTDEVRPRNQAVRIWQRIK